MKIKKLNEEIKTKTYQAKDKESQLSTFLDKRIDILKQTKKDILNGFNFEELMKQADREYTPRNIYSKDNVSTLITVANEDGAGTSGVNSSASIVDIGDYDKANWRSTISEPTLLVKIQTALSILINQSPEATLKASCEKYKKRSALAKSLLKRNWEINNSIEVLKSFVFDLAKYGFAVGHTLPRILKRKKEILEVMDTENPENNKYKKVNITEFNDIYREKLDLHRTWIDDKANLTDPFSINDWYYEKDYSLDDFKEEFGMYKNSKTVKGGTIETEGINSATKTRKDMVTVGFYENKKKDLYSIWIPNEKIILYYSPLPNDDGKLTLWFAYWLMRDPRTIYGIGLYELLKNNKVMYDRFKNMTIDQLTMAIYPMIFYTGVPMNGENEIKISPDKLIQKQAGTTIDQIKIQYDPRGWEATEKLNENIDDITGITPTLGGEVTGKTLGEVLHAKDSALKRLNIPLLNIAKAIEQDAYITLSWMNQVYSVPEIIEFADTKELNEYEEENDKANRVETLANGRIEADFYPEIELGIDEDREGNLIESPEDRFFRLGDDITIDNIKWEGKVIIKAKSIISPNPELERQRKLELYNVVSPVVQQMASLFYQHVDPKTQETYSPVGGKEVALSLYYPLNEILEIQDEKPENWIFKDLLDIVDNPEILEQEKQAALAQQEAMEKAKPENNLFIKENMLNNEEGGKENPVKQGGKTVVPQSDISNPLKQAMGSMKSGETKSMQSF